MQESIYAQIMELPLPSGLRRNLVSHPNRLEAIDNTMLTPDIQVINWTLAVGRISGTPKTINHKTSGDCPRGT